MGSERFGNSRAVTNFDSKEDDIIAQLEKLGELLEKGILTQEEFATQKSKLLG